MHIECPDLTEDEALSAMITRSYAPGSTDADLPDGIDGLEEILEYFTHAVHEGELESLQQTVQDHKAAKKKLLESTSEAQEKVNSHFHEHPMSANAKKKQTQQRKEEKKAGRAYWKSAAQCLVGLVHKQNSNSKLNWCPLQWKTAWLHGCEAEWIIFQAA